MPDPETAHFADRLLAAIEARGAAVCVGIDPVYDRLPRSVRDAHAADAAGQLDAIDAFAEGILTAVADHTPVVKLQAACFERYGPPGVALYHRVTARAHGRGLLVIGDVKRGDIGSTADHYAAATLEPPPDTDDPAAAPDAITINSYFGRDGIEPFLNTAAERHAGVFALVRTSNPGGDAIQALQLANGGTVAERVAGLIAEFGYGERLLSDSGYSLLGAVVGATKREEATRLRKLMPRQIFLVPGYGAQGAGVDDVRPCFDADGRGALITASRSITYAYEKADASDWREPVVAAAAEFNWTIAAIGQ